jgi:hypothetical protein
MEAALASLRYGQAQRKITFPDTTSRVSPHDEEYAVFLF